DDGTGRPLTEVFHIVNEQPRQPVESPVDRVLREGTVVGLANHTTLFARDGQEHLIDDSAAPILAEDGQTIGVVLVFRDVSVRRRAEAESDAARKELTHRLAGLTQLAELSTRLVPTGELHGPLLEILDVAIRITQADMGNIQLRDAQSGLRGALGVSSWNSSRRRGASVVAPAPPSCGRDTGSSWATWRSSRSSLVRERGRS